MHQCSLPLPLKPGHESRLRLTPGIPQPPQPQASISSEWHGYGNLGSEQSITASIEVYPDTIWTPLTRSLSPRKMGIRPRERSISGTLPLAASEKNSAYASIRSSAGNRLALLLA